MRLKDRDKKFSGDIGECWQEFVDEYRQIARDYGLTASQKLQYLHNLLRGDAKRYYLDTIEGYATTFQQSVDMVEKEYNSHVRQNKVKNYLKTLRMSKFVAEGADMASALEKVYKVILKLFRQAPATHRGDAHKVEFLSSAVAGYEWATEPLGRVAIYGLNFQQLYGELESQLQLSKEAVVARLKDQIFARSSGRSDNHDSKVPGILYQGQARYGRRPSSLRSDGRKRVSFGTSPTVKKFDPLSVSGCFNCDSPDHMLKDCRLPLNVARSASKKLEYYAKKKSNPDHRIHLVLAELCYQLDVSAPEAEEGGKEEVEEPDVLLTAESAEPHSDRDIFENLSHTADLSTYLSEVGSYGSLPSLGSAGYSDGSFVPEYDRDGYSDIVYATEDEEKGEACTVFDEDQQGIDILGPQSLLFENSAPDFLGVCVDTGAQKSVIGVPQAKAYCQSMGISFAPRPGRGGRVYKFGSSRYSGLGFMSLKIPIQASLFLPLTVEVFDVDVPLLLGLEYMDGFGTVIDVSRNSLSSPLGGWEVQLRRSNGHLFWTWPSDDGEVLYTSEELRKVHRHFYHPESHRLYSVLRRARPDETNKDDLDKLQQVERKSDVCQRLSKAPSRFRVSLPNDDVIFNRTVCMDLITIEGLTVLHCVDKDTKFNAAVFQPSETVESIWDNYRDMLGVTLCRASREYPCRPVPPI